MIDNLNRVAYIFGNNDYHQLNALNGSVNDACLVEEVLKKCGFSTNKFTDLNYKEFRSKVSEFKYACMGYHVGLFYYAGHGFEYKGENYLCPIDANMDLLEDTNISISGLVNEISKDRNFIAIIILDCCRTIYNNNVRGNVALNPIIPNFKNTGGTYVAYSTTSGEKAFERDGHGLYTRLLCEQILNSDKQIEQIFKDVRKEIIITSHNKNMQIPWEYSSLVDEFYFIEIMPNDNITSLANDAIKKNYQYIQIKHAVDNYCANNDLKDKNRILLNVLSRIDEILKESTYA